jgi:hypothetical protein
MTRRCIDRHRPDGGTKVGAIERRSEAMTAIDKTELAIQKLYETFGDYDHQRSTINNICNMMMKLPAEQAREILLGAISEFMMFRDEDEEEIFRLICEYAERTVRDPIEAM